MKKFLVIFITIILLAGCAKEVTEVIEKYDNGNWKKVIVYKVRGDEKIRHRAVEYYENGDVKREIILKDNPQISDEVSSPAQDDEKPAEPIPETAPDITESTYQGPYQDLMNQPGVTTRKLEGEEKEKVLEAMRKQREEQSKGEEFTEIDEDGNEIIKVRKVLETFEDGSTKHEQIYVKNGDNLDLETDNEFYSNGNIRTTVPYKYGKANGKWFNYYKDGKLKTEGSSEAGSHHGEYTQFYPNGKPMMKGNFKYGKMDGEWTYYYENGNMQMQTTFKDDQDIGPLKRYDKDGNPIKNQSPFRVGEQYNLGN